MAIVTEQSIGADAPKPPFVKLNSHLGNLASETAAKTNSRPY